MTHRLSRRTLLGIAGALALRPRFAAAAVPDSFDHMQLGCGDLQKGIDFVEKHIGIRAAVGGVHPGRGSRNALLSFGDRRYLEILAPDPAQPRSNDYRHLYEIESPRVIGWAAHVDDMDAVMKRLTTAGLAFQPVKDGSRKRPSGQVLRWKALTLKDDHGGLLPFFIEWSKDSPHPASDAPGGAQLQSFEIAAPNADDLKALAQKMGLDAPVVKAAQPALRTSVKGPKGSLSL
jgi:hypothetical protein